LEILYFLTLLFSHLASPLPPPENHSSKTGEVNELAIKEAEKIIGIPFQEKPSKLYFYSSKPNEIGGFRAFLKAVIPEKEFKRIVSDLGLKPRPGISWSFSPPESESWWDTTDRDQALFYDSGLGGEDPTYYVHYRNGAMYFYKHFQNYSQY